MPSNFKFKFSIVADDNRKAKISFLMWLVYDSDHQYLKGAVYWKS